MGSASHGVGLTKLKEYGEEDLSIGSLSMGLSAVIGAFIIPIICVFIYVKKTVGLAMCRCFLF